MRLQRLRDSLEREHRHKLLEEIASFREASARTKQAYLRGGSLHAVGSRKLPKQPLPRKTDTPRTTVAIQYYALTYTASCPWRPVSLCALLRGCL